jgi:NAD-dependent SIR2 family protein deacetylase
VSHHGAVPDPDYPAHHELTRVVRLVERGGVVVLSGAGLSTESGIPDYRGPSGATLRRHAPMTYQAFVSDTVARRRYWARSHLGWQQMAHAQPNAGHRAVAELERSGAVCGVITQNVDGLHEAAGSDAVIDLHGRLDRVVCLLCGALSDRHRLDVRLREANVGWHGQALATNPDGDVDVADTHLDEFSPVDCESCGGVLKPDVVYFGENVPRDRVDQGYSWVDGATALLVLGSSLHVFSGRRFVMRAAAAGIPVVIVNQGPTRGDDVAVVRIDAPLGVTLAALADGASVTCIGSRGWGGLGAEAPAHDPRPDVVAGDR